MANTDPWHEVEPEEFDEDLSELHESEESHDDTDYEDESQDEDGKEHEDCSCNGDDPDCACQTSAADDQHDESSRDSEQYYREHSEEESERSYQASDADYYYELKERRIERKRELLEDMKRDEEILQQLWALHEEKEKEVYAIRESLVQASDELVHEAKAKMESGKVDGRQHRPRLELGTKDFTLYSTEYIDHFWYPSLMNMAISMPCVAFYQMTADETWGNPVTEETVCETDCDAPKLGGQVMYLIPDFDFHFEPINIPLYASTQAVVLEPPRGEQKMGCEVEFLGGDYLILRIGRDFILDQAEEKWRRILFEETDCADAPEVLEFVGIHYDPKKRKAEMQRQEDAKRARREPSPRETFFEMNHPMGWWKQSGWG